MRAGSLTGLLLACCLSSVNAQEPAAWIPRAQPSRLFAAVVGIPIEATDVDTTARVVRPTHWKKGLMIGGLIGGAGLGWLVFSLCTGDNETSGNNCLLSTLGGAAIGAVLGGTVGALIGGQFPQRPDTVAAPDSAATSP